MKKLRNFIDIFPMNTARNTSDIWLDRINPPLDEIEEIFSNYWFHELDREAITEEHQYARLDTYEDYLFIVLHFPKYNPKTTRYIQNEIDIFVGKDYIITFRYYPSATMRNTYGKYEKRKEENVTNSPAYILYDIIESYLDKTMKMLEQFNRDLKHLEINLFWKNNLGTELFWKTRKAHIIHDIMIKKRNIITLKHMMRPQIPVLRLIETRMKERFSEEVEIYFENLEDKMNKIFSEIQIIEENVDSMEDTLTSIFNLDINTTITYLTIFSAFMLPLTLVTSFFGMNTESGHFHNSVITTTLIITTIVFVSIMYIFFKKEQ